MKKIKSTETLAKHPQTKKVVLEVRYCKNNLSAHTEILEGCICTAQNLIELEKEMRGAIAFHISSMDEDGEIVPDIFRGEYEFEFKFE